MGFRMPDVAARRLRLREALDVLVERLGRTDVQQAILFGSLARGTIHSRSDIDLILIRNDSSPFLQRLEGARSELDVPVALDLLVYTPEEFTRLCQMSPFVRQAVAEGRVIYEGTR